MLIATPFTASHWAVYQDWHSDIELSRRASYPDQVWFDYVTAPSVQHSIVAFEDTNRKFVSLAQFDIEDSALILFIAVDPMRRKQGIGKQTLNAVFSSAPLIITNIDAHIESDNTASIQLAQAAGFQALQDKPDKDGFVNWRFRL